MKTKLLLIGAFSIMAATAQMLHAPLKTGLKGITAFENTKMEATLLTLPSNDECSDAVLLTVSPDISCGSATSGTVTGATDSELPTINGDAAVNDVWFAFIATADRAEIAITNVQGDNGFLNYEIMQGDCSTLSILAGANINSLLVGSLNIGETYYIRVFSWHVGDNSTFDICVATPPPSPANDNCEGAVMMPVSTNSDCMDMTPGTLVSATNSNLPSSIGIADDDVWFSFVANSPSQLIRLANVTGMETDLVVEVLSGNCDSGFTSMGIFNFVQGVVSGLTVDETYYLRVFTYSGYSSDTNFKLCISLPLPPPVNDNCPQAIALTVNPDLNCSTVTPGSLYSATDSGIPASLGTPEDDVWFTFTAISETQKISFSNINNSSGLVFEVFSGDCDNPVSLYTDYATSKILPGLIPGEMYYIRVYTFEIANYLPIFFDVCLGTIPDAPANDDCMGAITLAVNPEGSCETVTAGNVAGASDSGVNPVTFNGTADDDVWFSFTATDQNHTIVLSDIIGSSNYMIMELFEGDCESLSSVKVTDSNKLNLHNLAIGTTYYLRVYTYTSDPAQNTSFNVCLSVSPPPPVNDNCDQAINLTVNNNGCTVVAQGTITNATQSWEDATENADDDVWYRFVATSEMQAISLSDIVGTTDALTIEVMQGECGNLTSIGTDSNKHLVLDNLAPGTAYYVRIYSVGIFEQQSGFDICVSIPPPVPDNDFCEGATALTLDSDYCDGFNTNGDTTSATDSGIVVAACFVNGIKDVWYRFTIPSDVAKVNISTDFTGGTLLDTDVTVYSGDCSNLQEIACDGDNGEVVLANGNSFLSVISGLAVNASETYYVRVAGHTQETYGTFCIKVSTDEILSAGGFAIDKLKAYPNPVKDILLVSDTENISSITVFDILGQQLIVQPVNTSESRVDMSGLTTGVYIVKIISDGVIKTIRISKE